MKIPPNKTKIICTLGPASQSVEVIEQMIRAGMNVARLNFSHGDFVGHKKVIENIRAASRNVGKRIAVMGDLPGPKMRIGQLAHEPIDLKSGDTLTLTTEQITGDSQRVSVSFSGLPQVVKPGDILPE
jgi:pyruvate kinase